MDGLRRVSDLFVEGAECYLGDGPDGPVVIWINKANAFEREEAQRDGIVRRAERLAQLGPDSPETKSVEIEMSFWDDDTLRERLVDGMDDELYVKALNDLSVDPKFRELEDYVRRAGELQGDEELADGDPRLSTMADRAGEYSAKIADARERVRREALEDLDGIERAKIEAKFLDGWRQARAFGEFSEAKRTTEIYLAARVCAATRVEREETLQPGEMWDHAGCDHSVRFFTERANVRRVPDAVLMKIANVLNELQMDPRDAGNWDAPPSSSDSSERPSTPEEASTPSTPADPQPVAPGI